MIDDQVTPQYERHPTRSYVQEGAVIRCYPIEHDTGGVDRKITLSAHPLFVMQMASKEDADMLMEDLYYGEYTGG